MKLSKPYIYFRLGQFIALTFHRCLLFCIIWWAVSEFSTQPHIITLVISIPLVFRLISLFFVGYMIDSFQPRKLALYSDILAICFISILLLIFLNLPVSIFLIIMVLSLYNIVIAISSPLDRIITFMMIKRENLALALNLQMNLELFAYLTGSVLSGIILTFASIEYAIILVVVGYIVSFYITARTVKSKKIRKSSRCTRNIFIEQLHSVKFLYRIKTERYFILNSALINSVFFCFIGYLLPIYIQSSLSLTAFYYTLSEFTLSVGFLFTLLFIHKMLGLYKKHDQILTFSIALLAVSFFIISISSHMVFLYITMFTLGISVAIYNTLTTSKRSLAVPERHRGRVFGLVFLVNESVIPIALFIVTGIYESISIETIFFIFGSIIILSACTHYLIPKFIPLMRLHEEKLDGIYSDFYPPKSNKKYRKNKQ